MFLASVAIGLYYNMIIAWTVYYTYSSMTSDLPWQYCNHDFNTPSEYRNDINVVFQRVEVCIRLLYSVALSRRNM